MNVPENRSISTGTGTRREGADGGAGRLRVQDDIRSGSSLTLSNVFKSYGQVEALKGVTFDVEAGEFLTLLGPSGSGKSTALMAIAGFEDISSGDILLDGKSMVDVPPHKREVGVVFQNYALFPHLSVEQNVAYPLKIRKLPKAELRERTRAALEMVELGAYGARRIQQLSGGQQQRVALARAFVFGPSLLLMDEPLSALDKNLRESMRFELKSLQRSLGITVVYVTHDQSEALSLSDRIAVIDGGVLQQIGTPSQIYDSPASSFVAKFLGDSNVFAVTIMLEEQGQWACHSDGGIELRVVGEELEAGRTVQVLLRPERIRIRPAAFQVQESQGALHEGRVIETTFLGDVVRYVVKVRDQRLIVKSPHGKEEVPIAPGEAVSLGWHQSDVKVLERRENEGKTDDIGY